MSLGSFLAGVWCSVCVMGYILFAASGNYDGVYVMTGVLVISAFIIGGIMGGE